MLVTLDNQKTLEIVKLPLGKYAELIKAFEELPKHLDIFKDFTNMSNEQFIQLIPTLLSTCLPDFIRIIKIATPLTEEEIQDLGLAEVIDIIGAVYTVNNYQAVYEKIKKFIPQRKEVIQPVIQPSTT